jgi:hypothetical protein
MQHGNPVDEYHQGNLIETGQLKLKEAIEQMLSSGVER